MLPELLPSNCMRMPRGFFHMMTLGWPCPFLWRGQIYFLILLYGWQLIQHWVLTYFQVCSNSAYAQHSGERYRTNDPLILLYGWQRVQHWVLMYFQVCSNSAYPQHSGERYRTNDPLIKVTYQRFLLDAICFIDWAILLLTSNRASKILLATV